MTGNTQDLTVPKEAQVATTPEPEAEPEAREDAPLIVIERKPESEKAPEAPKSIDDMSDDEVKAAFKSCGKRLSILKSRRADIEAEQSMLAQKSGHYRGKVIELEKKGAPEDEIRKCGRVLGRLYLDAKSLPWHLGAVKSAQFETHKVKDELKDQCEMRGLFGGSPQGLAKEGRKGKPGSRKRAPKTAEIAEKESELREMRDAGLISGQEFQKRKQTLRRGNRKRKSDQQSGKKAKGEKKDKKKGR